MLRWRRLREVKDDRAKRYGVILRQCRLLVHNSAMQRVVIKLVADKEEAEVAKVIYKTTRRQSGTGNPGAKSIGQDALVPSWAIQSRTRKVRAPAIEMLFLRPPGSFCPRLC